jgi:hypothetical protein
VRKRYWSCSRFADWLRGTSKPRAETSKGWHDWQIESKKLHPIRYWIAEEALDNIQDFVTWPLDKLYSIKYYINNRWVTRTHQLTAHPQDIKPGTWQDVGYRFLPCLFNELVDYVEIELAWSNIAWNEESRKKYRVPFWGHGWFRWRIWRCPEAGIEYLNWASGLKHNEDWVEKDDPNYGKPTLQAINAKETLELYCWWTKVRPARRDPYEASGWSELCEVRREKYQGLFWEDQTEEENASTKESITQLNDLEEDYETEDEEMLIRLIKIRRSLWT